MCYDEANLKTEDAPFAQIQKEREQAMERY